MYIACNETYIAFSTSNKSMFNYLSITNQYFNKCFPTSPLISGLPGKNVQLKISIVNLSASKLLLSN